MSDEKKATKRSRMTGEQAARKHLEMARRPTERRVRRLRESIVDAEQAILMMKDELTRAEEFLATLPE